MRILTVCALILFLGLPYGHTHGKHHHGPAKTIKQFVEKAHHDIDSHSFREAINPKSSLLRAIRWHNMNSNNPQFGPHAVNLGILILVTEGLEFATGPVTTYLVNTNDWPTWVDASLQSFGYFVSTPFILNAAWLGPLAIFAEPYCLAALTAYAGSKSFRNVFTKVRTAISISAQKACDVTGATSLYNKIYPKVESLLQLAEAGWKIAYNYESGLAKIMHYETPSGGVIELFLENEDGYYVDLMITENVTKKEFKKSISKLNWSARQLLVKKFMPDQQVQFKKREILIKDKRKLCSKLFRRGA